MSAFWSGHVGAAAGCRCRVLLEGAAVRVNAVLSKWCVRFGAACWCRCKVPLQGATGRCHCKMLLGAAAGVAAGFCLRCRCRVLLRGATVRVVCALWSGMLVRLQGATGRCHCKVPLQGAAWCRCRVSLQGSAWGAAAGCCLSFAPAGFFWGSKGHGIWHWHGLQGLDISHLLKCTASLLFGFLLADKFGVIVNKLCRATVVTLPALWSGRRWRVLLESAG